MAAILEITDLRKVYRKTDAIVRALDGVSLAVDAGEFVVVRGPSGCGKTTLLLTAGGLLEPDSGLVSLDGREPYRLSPEARTRLRAETIGFVFQQFHLIPYLTVLENVMTPALAATGDLRGAQKLLARFGLDERAQHLSAELSTGERQRTALARALLNRPRLLLADEPTGNLDPDNAAIVLKHMAEFAQVGGAVLLVTHDEVARGYADRIIRLEAGRVVPPPDAC